MTEEQTTTGLTHRHSPLPHGCGRKFFHSREATPNVLNLPSGLAIGRETLLPYSDKANVCSNDSGTGLMTVSGVGACTMTTDQAGNDSVSPEPQVRPPFSAGMTFEALCKLTAQFETNPRIENRLQLDLRMQQHFARGHRLMDNFFINRYITSVNAQRVCTLTDQQADTLIQMAQALWPGENQIGSPLAPFYFQSQPDDRPKLGK